MLEKDPCGADPRGGRLPWESAWGLKSLRGNEGGDGRAGRTTAAVQTGDGPVRVRHLRRVTGLRRALSLRPQVREKTAGVSARPLAPPRVRTRPRGLYAEARAELADPRLRDGDLADPPAAARPPSPRPSLPAPRWVGLPGGPTAGPLIFSHTRISPSDAHASLSSRVCFPEGWTNRLQGTRFQLRSRLEVCVPYAPRRPRFYVLDLLDAGDFPGFVFPLFSHE